MFKRIIDPYATIVVYHWDGHEIGIVYCSGPADVQEYESALMRLQAVGMLVIQYSTMAVDARLKAALALLRREGYLE